MRGGPEACGPELESLASVRTRGNRFPLSGMSLLRENLRIENVCREPLKEWRGELLVWIRPCLQARRAGNELEDGVGALSVDGVVIPDFDGEANPALSFR